MSGHEKEIKIPLNRLADLVYAVSYYVLNPNSESRKVLLDFAFRVYGTELNRLNKEAE